MINKAFYQFVIIFGLAACIRTGSCIELPQIIQEAHSSLSQLRFLHYTIKAHQLLPGSATLSLDWKESGAKCVYKYAELNSSGATKFLADYSFDGESSMRSFYGKGRIDIRKGPWGTFPDWIRNFETFASPYDFLLQSTGVNRWDNPPLETLKSPIIWANFLKNSQIIGKETYDNQRCTVVRVEQVSHRFIKDISTYYLVYFSDEKDGYPLAWKQFDMSNQLLSELHVLSEKIVRAGSVAARLPTKIQVAYYATNAKEIFKKPITTWTYEFGDISVDPTSDDKNFSLDIASARLIYDEDQKIFIAVPN